MLFSTVKDQVFRVVRSWRRGVLLSFYWWILVYLVIMSLFGAIAICRLQPHTNYLDAMVSTMSAIGQAGLNTLDIRTIFTGTQALYMILFNMGSCILLSSVPVWCRFFAYRSQRSKHRRHSFEYDAYEYPINASWFLGSTIIGYYICLHMTAIILLGLWFQFYTPTWNIIKANNLDPLKFPDNITANNINPNVNLITPWWAAVFHASSAINNCGYSFWPNGAGNFAVSPDKVDYYVLTILAICIAIGNNLYPAVLHLILRIQRFIFRKCGKKQWADICSIILLESRKITYSLFPIYETKIIALAWAGITLVQFCMFFTEWFNPGTLGPFTPGGKIMIIIFESISSRNAGLSTLAYSQLRTGHLPIIAAAMYIAATPFILSQQSSKIEKAEEDKTETEQLILHPKQTFKDLASNDVVWLFGAVIVIAFTFWTIGEGQFLGIFFEVASAYATSGMSTGSSHIDAAFVADFAPLAKFIMWIIILFGRLRQFPLDFNDDSANLHFFWESYDPNKPPLWSDPAVILAHSSISSASRPSRSSIDMILSMLPGRKSMDHALNGRSKVAEM